jgi:hypothetical protein
MQTLERFEFVHTLPQNCITEINGARRAILPVFKMGKTDLRDNRSFKMEEQDFSILKTNLAGKTTPCPVLFEHSKGPRGGLGGGKVISLQEKAGEIYAHATLTKRAYTECKDEEWLAVSGGFLASRDEDGNIHPVELLEISFTNMPAFPGLSGIQTFSVLKELPAMVEPNKGTESQVEVIPTPPVVVAEVKLESVVTPPEPEKVSVAVSGVEVTGVVDKVTPEPVELDSKMIALCPCPNCPCPGCGCCEGDLAGAVASPCPCPDCPCPGCACCTADAPMSMETEKKEDVVHLTAEQTESVIELAATARFDEKVKKEKIIVLMALGDADGKIIPANKEAMQTLANADPDAFKVVLATMKPILPIKKSIGDAVIKVDLGLLDTSPEHEAAILSKAVQLKAQHPELSLAELSLIVKKHTV